MTDGLTAALEPETTPTPWLIESSVAPLTLHDRTDVFPTVIVGGEAVKDATTGAGTGVTVTVALAFALPEEFVAVRV